MTRRTKIALERKKLRLSALADHGSIGKGAYFEELSALQMKLQRIQQAYLFTGDSAVIVFEGWDAAGKGGTIRRISAVLDPRGFKVWPIAAPRAFEKERHYLFRFWERLPPHGAISVFDRSWYGRVLVASWSSGSRAPPSIANGGAPTTRSTSSSASSSTTAPGW